MAATRSSEQAAFPAAAGATPSGAAGAAGAAADGREPACPLCEGDGGEVLWRDERLRVILPDEALYPGFTRVVWRDHVCEMTDLAPTERSFLMSVVWEVEAAQREALAPDKINLASFGNLVPHLHWHVIPRWRDDPHFPEPVWGRLATSREDSVLARQAAVRDRLAGYRALLLSRLD